MTYAEALLQIVHGGYVARPHWHGVMLRASPYTKRSRKAKDGLCVASAA